MRQGRLNVARQRRRAAVSFGYANQVSMLRRGTTTKNRITARLEFSFHEKPTYEHYRLRVFAQQNNLHARFLAIN